MKPNPRGRYFEKRPRNKANMDEPQEEFIAPSGTHVNELRQEGQPASVPRNPKIGTKANAAARPTPFGQSDA
jgi:hypothetical protein